MASLIDQYFITHLSLPPDEAKRLTREYYTKYGLAIEGLVRHHQIDPLDFNAKVDDALPLQDILSPDAELRRLLEDIDTDKVRLWLFTNAYVTHGKRVVRLLGIDDLFEGLTFCDYAQHPFVCKPSHDMFRKAMQEAVVERGEDCYFVGESFPFPVLIRGQRRVLFTYPSFQMTRTPTARVQRSWAGRRLIWLRKTFLSPRRRHRATKFAIFGS